MDKRKVAGVALKTATRYPKPTLRVGKSAVRHRRGLVKAARVVKTTTHGTQAVIERVTDKHFQDEISAALNSLQAAAGRTQKLGPTKATHDQRVASLVKDAVSHLTVAAKTKPKRSHRFRNLAIGAVLVSAVVGAAALGAKSRP